MGHIKLTGLVLLSLAAIAGPAWAGGGTIEYAYSGNFSDIWKVDGLYFKTWGPNPNVTAGAWNFQRVIHWFSGGAWYYNAVGFAKYKDTVFPNWERRRLTYEIYGPGQGDTIYWLPDCCYWYDAGTQVNAGLWRNSGNNWHFNWWGPNFNHGADADNNAGSNDAGESDLGANAWYGGGGPEGSNGCPNDEGGNDQWYFIWRNKQNSSWYYFPSTSEYRWGSNPTWQYPIGNAGGGATITLRTQSCP